MVWRRMSLDGCMDLYVLQRGNINAQRYRDKVLELIVKLYMYASAVGENFILMHDNALALYTK